MKAILLVKQTITEYGMTHDNTIKLTFGDPDAAFEIAKKMCRVINKNNTGEIKATAVSLELIDEFCTESIPEPLEEAFK